MRCFACKTMFMYEMIISCLVQGTIAIVHFGQINSNHTSFLEHIFCVLADNDHHKQEVLFTSVPPYGMVNMPSILNQEQPRGKLPTTPSPTVEGNLFFCLLST